jgi:hypothetical protein
MGHSSDLKKHVFVNRTSNCFSNKIWENIGNTLSEVDASIFREKFKKRGKFYDRNIFSIMDTHTINIIACLELLDLGYFPEDFEYYLSQGKLSNLEPILSLFSLVREEQGKEPNGQLPIWIVDLELNFKDWGLLANILFISFKLGQSCSYFLNPVLNKMSDKGMTFADSVEAIYRQNSWNDFRKELVDRTWEMVGHPSKESAMKVVGF